MVSELTWNSIGVCSSPKYCKVLFFFVFYQKAKCKLGVQSSYVDFHRSVRDISLSLVMDQDFSFMSPIIECQNKIIKVNEVFSALSVSSCQIEPPQKKMKLDLRNKNDLKKDFHKRCSRTQLGKTNTVTAVTNLSPLLAFHRVCCTVILHAKKQKHRNGDFLKSKRITLLCGKILLSLEDISNGKYSVNMLKDNSYCTGKWIDGVWIHEDVVDCFFLDEINLHFQGVIMFLSLNSIHADF